MSNTMCALTEVRIYDNTHPIRKRKSCAWIKVATVEGCCPHSFCGLVDKGKTSDDKIILIDIGLASSQFL